MLRSSTERLTRGNALLSGPVVVPPEAAARSTTWEDTRERRLEDWIVSSLEDRPVTRSAGFRAWEHAMEGDSPLRTSSATSAPTNRHRTHRGWARIRVTPHRDKISVKILGSTILSDPELDLVSEELLDLAAAGHTRLIVDFQEIQRLTSRIVGVLIKLWRQCVAAEGGMLRLCGLRGEVSQLFSCAGLGQSLPVDPDEQTSLDAAWPPIPGLRPLNVSILESLREKPRTEVQRRTTLESTIKSGMTCPSESRQGRLRVHLELLSGKARGRASRVLGSEILIGRDRSCNFRIDDVMVSRHHASIRVLEQRIVLRDLDSTNGTRRNGQLLQGTEVDLADGDRIHVGPVSFLVRIEDRPTDSPDLPEDTIAGWLEDREPLQAGVPSTLADQPLPVPDDSTTGFPSMKWLDENDSGIVRAEVIDGVVVLTPMISRLEDEGTVEDLREILRRAFEGSDYRRIVVDLSHVTHLSSRAIGVLLAHHLRLEREGGALRLCHVPARVHAVLDRIRIPMLVGTFSKVDDAVITVWE